ncbi:MAG: PD-(D/E)XK nuclease family protein, partial [Gammaproteobacteria bacterium]
MTGEAFDPARLDDSVTVVTSTGRLTRAVREAHARARQTAGETCWSTPDVLPWSAWVARCFRELRARGHLRGALLPAASREVLWAQVVAEDAGERVLSPPAIAAAGAQADVLLHDHVLDPAAIGLDASADTRAFARWRDALGRRCDALGYVNAVKAADALMENAGVLASLLRQRLFVLGFDDLPLRHARLLDALAAAGVDPMRAEWRNPRPARRTGKAEFADPSSELSAVARWCARLLDAGEPGPIGVVIQDLDRRLGVVKDRFEDVLGATAHGRHDCLHISLGPALAQREMIADALAMLRMARASVSAQDVGRLLLSVYTEGAQEERTARATLHVEILDRGSSVLPPQQMGVLVGAVEKRCDRLLDIWTGILERLDALQLPRKAMPSHWATQMGDVLRAFGWPGDRALDSLEHQTLQAWNDLLDAFAALDDVLEHELDYASAVETLHRMTAGTIFAPKAQPAPVQIMGLLEASGLSFSHLWVCGLDDARWPPPANPTAFLPYDVQRETRMPNASPTLALERARRMTCGWLHAATEEVVLSYAATEGDAERGPSPLLDEVAACDSDDSNVGTPLLAFDRLRMDSPALETFVDWQAPPVPVGAKARGGSNSLKDYAACPFRAFARHRLGASAPERGGTPPDPITRGLLIHEAARAAWRRIRSYDALMGSSDDELARIARNAAAAAIGPIAERYDGVLDERTIDIERKRCAELLYAWLDGERRREPFEVLGHERAVVAELAGLRFGLRIDRIDTLEGGQALLIDYKTGRSNSATSWM